MKLIKIIILILFFSNLYAEEKELVIYSNKYLPMQGVINKMFYDKTGIVVSISSSSEEDLLDKLNKKRFRDKADMVMGATLYEMAIIKESGFLQKIEDSAIINIIPKEYQDISQDLIPISLNPRVLVYNRFMVEDDYFSSYVQIFPKESDIKTSQRTFLNKYNRALVAYLIKIHGEKAVEKWLLNLSENLLEKPKGNDRYNLRKVAKGEATYTFANASDLGLMANSKSKSERNLYKSLNTQGLYLKKSNSNNFLNLFDSSSKNKLPKEKVSPIFANIFTVGIINNAKNKDYAIAYIKFLLSKEIQDYIAEFTYEIPINKESSLSKIYHFPKKISFESLNYDEVIFYEIKADNLIKRIPNLLP